MLVVDHATLPRLHEPGHSRFAAASPPLGGLPFELWVETLSPNAGTEIAFTSAHRAIVVLSGYGNLRVEGAPQHFRAPCTLLLPVGCECQVLNIGTEPLEMILAVALPQP